MIYGKKDPQDIAPVAYCITVAGRFIPERNRGSPTMKMDLSIVTASRITCLSITR